MNKQETTVFLKPYCTRELLGTSLQLPQIANAGDTQTIIFQEKEIFTEAAYVWRYQNDNRVGKLSRYGSVIIEGKVLCTDEAIQSFFKDIWKPDYRTKYQTQAFIALFSQHQDGILYGGYYDYVFCIAAKICRIKDTFPDEDFSKMFVSYPIFKTDYETEFLSLLGIDTDNVVDSRKCQLISSQIIMGNAATWYPSIDDVLSLRRHIFKKISFIKNTGERIYISRSCRRNIINENELIALLRTFDFTIIEDKPRSISEQISIYYNASFIIGPHGASFSNIIWCQPGTHLMELFSPNYTPDFFLFLATVMGMTYSAYYEGPKNTSVTYRQGLVEDIYVSIPKLELYLRKTLILSKALDKVGKDEPTRQS